jgi:hypothetical protein
MAVRRAAAEPPKPRLIVAAAERLNGGPDGILSPRIREETMSMTEIRRESATLLPGRTVRTLVFWRYLLLYRAPRDADARTPG